MNNATLLSDTTFHPRISQEFRNVKQALQYPCETKLGLPGFTQVAAESVPCWQMLSSFYNNLNHGMAGSLGFY